MSDAAAVDPIIRPSQLKPYTGLSKATIYRLIAKDSFPAAKQLGDQAVGWPLSAINEWRAERGLPPTAII